MRDRASSRGSCWKRREQGKNLASSLSIQDLFMKVCLNLSLCLEAVNAKTLPLNDRQEPPSLPPTRLNPNNLRPPPFPFPHPPPHLALFPRNPFPPLKRFNVLSCRYRHGRHDAERKRSTRRLLLRNLQILRENHVGQYRW